MKRKKTLWARTVPAVAFGVLMSFAVLVHTPVSADESAPATEPSEEAHQTTLAQADVQPAPAAMPASATVNLTGLAEASMRAKILKMTLLRASTKKCSGSTAKWWIVTF